MTLEDYDNLIKMKSNVMYHVEKDQNVSEAKKQLEGIVFPVCMKKYKQSLERALEALASNKLK